MKNLFKKISGIILAVISVISLTLFGACGGNTNNQEQEILAKINTFHETVVASQTCLDEVADDIYRYWYDAIYKDKYYGSIDIAIASAQIDNKTNLDTIETNESIIQSLYKEIRDSKLSFEIKSVMSAYSDYYEFVVNVSGSFNSYSASKETLKKELASALKDLALEL